ncbi:MAG: CoA-binding protein [Ignavibacteriales bacterium]|nr:MAG: CoA-binding protein [Ignavibacteriales bacterium]
MTSKKLVEDFLSQKDIAVVGVSATKKKFGYIIFTELKAKGYNVYPVNPKTDNIDGERCYPDLISLRGEIQATILVVPPAAAKEVVKDAVSAGIKKIWMQQGSESNEAIQYCKENGIDVIDNECILMFAQPSGFIHRAHKWVWGLAGKLPQ